MSTTEQHIFIPDRCPLEVDLTLGDILTITFTETVYLWNSDPTEFDPPLEIDIYQRNTTWSGIAGKIENVTLGWLALIPGPQFTALVTDQKLEVEPRTKRVFTRGATVTPCTIHVGSGFP